MGTPYKRKFWVRIPAGPLYKKGKEERRMPWGIAETASGIEKIRAESSDMLGGLNSVGEIDYTTYSELWDFYHDLLGKAYEQCLKDAPNDKRKEE